MTRPAVAVSLRAISAMLLFGLGCASFRPVDPDAGPVELGGNEGLLVLHVQTDVRIEALYVSGFEVGGPLEPGTHLWMVAASVGEHDFNRIDRKIGGLEYYYTLYDDTGDLGFDVRPGQINYPGLMRIRRARERNVDPDFVSIHLTNRTSILLADLEQRHGPLLAHYPLRYTGRGWDRFVEELERARAIGARAGADRP